ncbi:MAG: alpha-amylase family glycosyl hydrolase [Mycobacterium leprae]
MNKRWAVVALAATLLIGSLAQGCSSRPAASVVSPQAAQNGWLDESIYFIMVDRFNDGDPGNDQGVNLANPKAWHGGDLQGVIDKLDYIKSMGFTAIWLTPIVKNVGNDYHGYGAIDFFQVDPHFGTIDKAKELVDKAHAKGIKVIFDVVVNHTGPYSPLVTEHPDWFHPKSTITNWNDPKQVQDGWIYDLPDFDQTKQPVRDYILSYSKFWIEKTDADGFRLDTVRHVPEEFFTWYAGELQKAKPGFWLIGEVYDSNPMRLAPYQKTGITAMLDFPTDDTARAVFANDRSMTALANTLNAVSRNMIDPYQMGGFLDNHDMSRFATLAHDDQLRRLKLALTFLFTNRNIPILYYGTEIAMPGGNDPDNRHDFPWGKEQNTDVRELVTKLNQLRAAHPAFRRGTITPLISGQWHYAYFRSYEQDAAVVVLNNDAEHPFTDAISLGESGLADGTVLKDALTGAEAKVAGGKLQVNVAPRTGAIYLKGK